MVLQLNTLSKNEL